MDHRSIVETASRWLLGEVQDDAFTDHFAARLADGSITEDGLRDAFLRSERFARNWRGHVRVELLDGPVVVVESAESEFGHALRANRTWEPHLVEVLDEVLRPGDTVVDIGANVGVMTFRAARRVGPEGRVLAFEPLAANASCLLRGVAANGFENVIVRQAAATDGRRPVFMSLLSNSKVRATQDPLHAPAVAQGLPLDDALAHEPRLDFIKLDIEGHEPWALRGALSVLRRHSPWVLCEFNPQMLGEQNADPADMARLVFDLTDRVAAIDSDGRRGAVHDADGLMALWADRDAASAAAGRLPAGWVHFDLLFKVGG